MSPGEQVLITVRDRNAAARRRSLRPVPGPLAAGERVLLIDPKDRRYLVTLVTGATFHTHAGVLAHDDIIGADRGLPRRPARPGGSFLVLRPTLSDIVLKMPRGAQVIYPKDLGAILIAADIAPGPAGARGGRGLGRPVDDGAAGRRLGRRLRAARGLRRAGPGQRGAPRSAPTRPTGSRSATSPRASTSADLDRILLDMPEPHKVVRRAPRRRCGPGGILLAYLPTINQTALLRQALDDEDAPFGLAETQEILRRTWHVEARSVRPDHRMVGHTGFLTTARA